VGRNKLNATGRGFWEVVVVLVLSILRDGRKIGYSPADGTLERQAGHTIQTEAIYLRYV